MTVTSILIANRGEIAVRLIRACHDEGLDAVAVYSDADSGARHVRTADLAVPLGGNTAAESYLNGEAILAAARATGADAIHPGYGFLSENTDFAAACADAGVIFIGAMIAGIATFAAALITCGLGTPLVGAVLLFYIPTIQGLLAALNGTQDVPMMVEPWAEKLFSGVKLKAPSELEE